MNTLLGANGSRTVRIVVLMKTPSLNDLKGKKYRNHHDYTRLRNEWQRTIYYSVPYVERSWLLGMQRAGKKMRLTIHVAHKKLYDVDNLIGGCKPVVDALKHLLFLKDDSPEFMELHITQEKLNDARTTITLEDAQEVLW